jgi:1-hydroxycarotenoid 3,4-desaturase
MRGDRVCIIGAGVGGLAAAVTLAARGLAVTVLERGAAPGGKFAAARIHGHEIDCGPTVFTMAWVFEELFAEAGARLADHLALAPVQTLARHAWPDGSRLDLFADIDRSADAIAAFAGRAEADGYRAFTRRAQRIFNDLDASFLQAERPAGPLSLVRRAGIAPFLRTSPFATLWGTISEHFRDPRLCQLFGRYATYCGSSPYLAPATLMLVAHVEQQGVWLVQGGMHRIAAALAALAAQHGAVLRLDSEVAAIEVASGAVAGVRLASGERIAADAVIANADCAALAAGLFGREAARAVEPTPPAERSLSAITWAMLARPGNFPLLRHSVFFSTDYSREFRQIFHDRMLPREPTVYVCAQDRGDTDAPPGNAPERLLVLVNAPPVGDTGPFHERELLQCQEATFSLLHRCGLTLAPDPAATIRTTPFEFAQRFPGTGGALYGRAVHGAMATFRRPGSRTTLPGLYLAGGSAHPGAGVPTATLSGRIAAKALLSDLGSTSRSRRAAMPGGTSMR